MSDILDILDILELEAEGKFKDDPRYLAQKISEERLKREAKKLKKEIGVRHTDALDLVARSYGFSSYRVYINTRRKNA